MVSTNLVNFLFIGAIIMCLIIAVQMKWYNISPWKSIAVSLAIIITGLISCDVWFFLENGVWGGKSFFGAIFLAPLTFVVVALVLRIPYFYALDYCATAGCFIFSLLKVDCLIGGCCKGIILFQNQYNHYIRFPSQLVELLSALFLTVALFLASRNEKNRGKIYPFTLLSYGCIRFVLNLLRDDWQRARDMGLCMPIGCFWALLSVLIGILWLFVAKKPSYSEKDSTALLSE